MPLMTRCSHCQTVFRITPEQLRAHGGRVRCGRCLQVFNGLETLVPDVQVPAAADATAVGMPAIVKSTTLGMLNCTGTMTAPGRISQPTIASALAGSCR